VNDICACVNEECPLKAACLRSMGKPEMLQAYARFEPVDGKCDHFIEIRKTDKLRDKNELRYSEL
jgi:hypothetical protein